MVIDLSQWRTHPIRTALSLGSEARAAGERAWRLRMRALRRDAGPAQLGGGPPVGDDEPGEPTRPPFRVDHAVVSPSRFVVRVTGEIDVATAPALAEALRCRLRSAEPGTELDVDLAAVTFVDARGLAALLEAAEAARAAGVAFRVIGGPPVLRRIVEITGTGPALRMG